MRSTALATLAAASLVIAGCGGGSSGVAVGGASDAGTSASTPDDTATSTTADSTPDTTDDPSTPTTDAPDEPTSDPGTSFDVEKISWSSCGERLECGRLKVPLDYDRPDGKTIELAMVRHLAMDPADRIGSLLVNPGGPGYGGSFLAQQAEFIYSQDLLDYFDIVGFDPRGTGDSTPAVDCVDEYDPYFGLDPTPDDAAEKKDLVDAAEEFGAGCEDRAGDILPYISTEFAARDLDLMRQALGEKTISYFGFSYGSELGSVWVKLFPDTVRAAVLDGAADPGSDYTEGGLQQAVGFEKQIDTFLARCSADSDCDFHNDGDAEAAFDQLLSDLDADPLVVSNDRAPVNQAVALTGVANAMYAESMWPGLERALNDAQNGDGAGLLGLYDDYLGRQADGTYGDEFEAFMAISCLDDPGPRSVEAVDATEQRFLDAAKRLGPLFASGYTCALWPVEPHGKIDVTGAGDGPVVVIGTTGDPATPLSSSRAMADTLADGRLIVVTADRHTGYGVNSCVNDAVDDYLVDLKPPKDELACE